MNAVYRYLLGNRLGNTACLILSVYFMLLASITLRTFVYIINVYYLLPHTVNRCGDFDYASGVIHRVFWFANHGAHLAIHLPVHFRIFRYFPFDEKNYDVSSIFPLFEIEIPNIVKSLIPLCFTSAVLFISFYLFPQTINHKMIHHVIRAFSILSCVILLAVYAIGLMNFGSIFLDLRLPFDHIYTIYKGSLLERIDIFYMSIMLPLMGFFLSFWFCP